MAHNLSISNFNMKEVKQFIISATIMVVLVGIADICCGKVMYRLLGRMPQTESQASRTNYALTAADADCFIIGNSRASEHYVSNIIADSIGMTVYNAGRDGHGMKFNNCILTAIFERNKPSIVVMDYDDEMIIGKPHAGTLNDLKPYFRTSAYIHDRLLQDNSKSFGYGMHSNLFTFNNFPIRIAEAYVKPHDKHNGYCSRGAGHIKDAPLKSLILKNHNEEINPSAVTALQHIITLCQENGATLVFISSPSYSGTYTTNPLLHSMVDGLDNVYVINNMQLPEFYQHPELFSDHNHLNGPGSELYSQIVASQLNHIKSH